ncbi:MAG: hypothetical protein B6D63_06420 [Candidatus Latescibacteria bacterium 4484_7]|nr:MAG: hypothetical protein B6D63_06420 [Candidatus Latescibacteria bacterium 4484_7]
MKRLVIIAVTSILMLSIAATAFAAPRLQTYIVGSKYHWRYGLDRSSWVTNNQNFDLKVVGYWRRYSPSASRWNSNFLGCHQGQPRYDYLNTYVVISVPKKQSGQVWINGVEVQTFSDYLDAVPGDVSPAGYLRWHRPSRFGKFNFTNIGVIDNDQINAMHYNHGRIMSPGWGDEILLNIVVRGYDWAHFDAVGVNSRGRTFTNPPGYDSSYFATPEPGTLSLLGLGLLGLVPIIRRKKK